MIGEEAMDRRQRRPSAPMNRGRDREETDRYLRPARTARFANELSPSPSGRSHGGHRRHEPEEHRHRKEEVPKTEIVKFEDEMVGEEVSDRDDDLPHQSVPNHGARVRKPMKIIDWRGELCRLLDLDPSTPDEEVLEELEKAETLLEEAKQMDAGSSEAEDANPRCQVIYGIRCHDGHPRTRLHLEEPWVAPTGPYMSHLRSGQPIRNFELFLERGKDISFLVYKNFECCRKHIAEGKRNSEYDDPESDIAPHFVSETIEIVSDDLSFTLQDLAKQAFGGIEHPPFETTLDSRKDSPIVYPYLWWYHRRDQIEQTAARFDLLARRQIATFRDYLDDRLGEDWKAVDSLVSRGMISLEYLDYLFVPEEIVVSTLNGRSHALLEGHIARFWLPPTDKKHVRWSSIDRAYETARSLDCESWSFDGNFQKKSSHLRIHVPTMKDEFPVTQMSVYPLKFASKEVQAALWQRGQMFWKCRRRRYVCYTSSTEEDLFNVSDQRFMIDIAIYHQMHPPDSDFPPNHDELGPDKMSSDGPPDGDSFLMCLPNTIPGFHMQKKEWVMLEVSRLRDVEWNKEAFDLLVADHETKELIRALVENQCNTEKNTDLISGKGNGLFILLHGAPGTGKTLTAETVAEIAEKPLYRVTCGDIGTKAEDVEKYLETVLLLGKTWGCVVLLDEADVFLEERTFFDLQRNALVSVFLRVLEYYEGILILTSNRVATFDEAFISRMQLTLRYKNLQEPQRKTIWGNLITHLERHQNQSRQRSKKLPSLNNEHNNININGGRRQPVKELEINAEEIRGNIDQLAEAELNGRQIRNAVSTARQLAMFRGESMRYGHLKKAIEELEKFSVYLKEVKGLSEDLIQRDKRVR